MQATTNRFQLNAFPGIYEVSPEGNDNTALIPEFWAREALYLSESNMVAAGLVHRDFQSLVSSRGDTVNAHRPNKYSAKRKGLNDVTLQAAVVDNIPVVLNQQLHVSILLRDGEESKSFKDLANLHLKPMILAEMEFLDAVVLGQYPSFLKNAYGTLGGLDNTNARDYILGTREVLNTVRAPMNTRNLIWNPSSETHALSLPDFTNANTRGDSGSALEEARMGRLLGFDHYMCQNMAVVDSTDTTSTAGLINNAGGYNKGDTVLTVDGFAGADVAANQWVTIAGVPYRVVTASGSPTTSVTIASPGLVTGVADDAAITSGGVGAVNLAAGYAAGSYDPIIIDGFTIFPKVGQAVTFGTDPTSQVYTIIQASEGDGTITLDIPLVAALADDDLVNVGPAGEYNLGFHRDAIALVVRPLAAPRVGAASSVVNDNNLSMRTTITYDGIKQGHIVTVDMLFGIAILDVDLAAVLLG